MNIIIYGTHYIKKDTFGDFNWMCNQVEYNDREVDIFHYDYVSKYVGKDLRIALMQVIYM